MNVSDMVNMLISTLKITGKGTGAIQENEDGSKSAVILTYNKKIQSDIVELSNGNSGDLITTSGEEQKSPEKTFKRRQPVVSMEDLYKDYSTKKSSSKKSNTSSTTKQNKTLKETFQGVMDYLAQIFVNIFSVFKKS